MICKDIKSELVCYYYGDVSEDDRKKLVGHLKVCPDCRTFFEEISKTLQTVDKAAIKEGLNKRYIQGVYEKIERKERKWLPLPIPRLIPVTALILLFVFLGIFRYRNIRREKEFLLQNYEVIENMTMLEDIEVLEILDLLDAMEGA